jgi:RNA polymerase sigma-32 factor
MAGAPREPEVLPAKPKVDLPVPSSSDRALGPVDALSAYMNELGSYPPISREEEHELAVRWTEKGDVEAARRLVLSNLRLVVKIAMEYRRAWVNVLDLIQDGNVGLLEAVQRYDPYKGVKLSSYAVYWIRAYILKYILDNFRIVRLGTTRAQRKLFFRLNKEKRKLERQGFEVEPQLLAERLDVTEADVVDMDQRLSQSDLSTNAPARRDESEGAEFGDFLSAAGPSAESTVADAELRRVFMERVQDFSETLEERDQKLLEERVLADEPKTLAELGEELGVSRERVRQLEARIVSRLREYMRDTMVDFEYYAVPKDG